MSLRLISHEKTGNVMLKVMARPCRSCASAPIPANANPIGKLPVAEATRYVLNGMRANPARQDTASGKTGNQREASTNQAPPRVNSISVRASDSSPAHQIAIGRPTKRESP
jgi:hypothetical protein